MDEIFLQRAVDLAFTSLSLREGGPFGAVVVRGEEIIAEGWNRVIASNDPTAHAEVLAIRAACAKLGRFHLADCTLYASSEPCPLCLSAAYWARLQRIVFANPRTVAAAIGFCDAELYQELRRPVSERHLPTEHLALANADEPLHRWCANPQRVNY